MPKTKYAKFVDTTAPYSLNLIKEKLSDWKTLSREYEEKITTQCLIIKDHIKKSKDHLTPEDAIHLYETISMFL